MMAEPNAIFCLFVKDFPVGGAGGGAYVGGMALEIEVLSRRATVSPVKLSNILRPLELFVNNKLTRSFLDFFEATFGPAEPESFPIALRFILRSAMRVDFG